MSGFISKFLRPHEAEGLTHVRSYLWFFGFLVVILFLISITDSGTRIGVRPRRPGNRLQRRWRLNLI